MAHPMCTLILLSDKQYFQICKNLVLITEKSSLDCAKNISFQFADANISIAAKKAYKELSSLYSIKFILSNSQYLCLAFPFYNKTYSLSTSFFILCK